MSRGRLARLTAGVAGATAVLTLLTVLARVTGFARWFAQSAWVGSNEIGTAYATANLVPNVLFEVAAGGALAGVVVPVLAAPIARQLRGDIDRTASALLSWTLLLLVPLGAITWLLADPLLRLLLPGDAVPDQVAITVALLRMFALQIPLYGVGVVLAGVLQAHRRFVAPAVAPLLSSVVVMGSYFVFGRTTAPDATPADVTEAALAWLGWGTTAGVVALSLPLLVPTWRAGVRLRPTLRFPDGVARRVRSLALAGAGGLVAQQISVLVAARMANTYGGTDGVINVNQYATAVVMLPYAVLAVPLATTMFPRLAEHASAGRHDVLARRTAVSTRVLVMVAAAGTAALMAASGRVESVFAAFARGEVDGLGAAITAAAPSVVGLALLLHLSRVLFALERGRQVLLGTSLSWLTVALLSWLLVAFSGGGAHEVLRSLGLATSAGTLVGAGVLALLVRRELGSEALSGLSRTGAVALFGVGAGALLGRVIAGAPGDGAVLDVVLGALAGGAAFLVVLAAVVAADRGTVTAMLRRDTPAAAETQAPDAGKDET